MIKVGPGTGNAYSTPTGSGIISTAAVAALASKPSRRVDVTVGGSATTVNMSCGVALSSTADVAAALESASRSAKSGDPVWAQAVVLALDNGRLQVLSGVGDTENVRIQANAGDTTASELKLLTAADRGSFGLAGGGDGAHPGATEIVGSQAQTGRHALENTDFTLLCRPSIANQHGTPTDGLPGGTGYATVTDKAIMRSQHTRRRPHRPAERRAQPDSNRLPAHIRRVWARVLGRARSPAPTRPPLTTSTSRSAGWRTFLETTIYNWLKWVVFEPNDEPLWSQIRLNVGSFMQTLFQQGAVAGKTPRAAYIVMCDCSTTTPNDQAKGIVNMRVGFAPLRPAEFVILQISQLAGQT